MGLPPVEGTYGPWLVGLIDGEGCFTISEKHQGDRPSCYGCNFDLKLRLDDGPMLREVCELTGLGTVADVTRTGESKSGQANNPQVRWSIRSKADCWGLAGILGRYPLRSKKARDFVVWQAALEYWSLAVPGKRFDWEPMARLKHLLIEQRRFGATTAPLDPITGVPAPYAARVLRRAIADLAYLAHLPVRGHDEAADVTCAEFGHDARAGWCDRCGRHVERVLEEG